jgi:hypothetical protein
LLLHGNAPPNPKGDDDEDNNKDDKEDDDEDECDVTTSFNEVACHLQGGSYSAERAGGVAADQPIVDANSLLPSLSGQDYIES